LHFLGASGWLDGWAKPQSSYQAIQAGLIIDNSAYSYTGAVGLARRGGELGGKNDPDDHEDTLALFWQR
jgi:hypothetical protein